MKRLLREPLAHFVVIALVLLATDGMLQGSGNGESSIVVDDAVVSRLRQDFQTQHGRAMTPAEQRAAVERHKDEETLFRTALSLDLHKTDSIVRRRLIQRMRFLTEDSVKLREPTDSELEEVIREHPDKFPPVRYLSFEHCFFARSTHGAAVRRVARAGRADLLAGKACPGDTFPRRLETSNVQPNRLASQVGPETAEAFFQVSEGTWSDPISSAYGHHLIRPTRRDVVMPALAQYRKAARNLWRQQQQQRIGRELLASIRRDMQVTP